MTEQVSFTCPRCGRTSHNRNDVREGYCGYCHAWTGDEPESDVLLRELVRLHPDDRLFLVTFLRQLNRGLPRDPQDSDGRLFDAALTQCLIEHKLAIEDREAQRTDRMLPDQSDIYAKTRDTIKALCSGTLSAEEYLAQRE